MRDRSPRSRSLVDGHLKAWITPRIHRTQKGEDDWLRIAREDNTHTDISCQ